ncbi:MAG: type III secretion system export apparatus subunit SctV [Acidobacteria bacterium]|nr:type III secretion system export apparatus subunit SctV [Acidobacteriota bacterium]
MIEKIQTRALDLKRELSSGNLSVLLTRFSDLLLVACVGAMVGMMIIPLPTWLLDILLTVNITIAVTLLMVSIYISKATQIASYPTLLLITTLYRLALDISATRLILSQANAGEVIRAFGMFVVSGNFVVGAVIFLIITLVQFIVITKGAERVAEVSARFTLDAMPGKQMSIDADIRSGSIDFEEGRRRRENLNRESQFYGAMDGAMKFVKGDAIAGIIITLINILGGLIIGMAMKEMELMKAVQTYSILTIGNGLVSQIPALLISISAGMVITRVASENSDANLATDVASQILAQPKAIAVSSGFLLVLALVPGLPKIPFLLLAGVAGAVAYGLLNAKRSQVSREAVVAGKIERSEEPQITVTVPLALEVGQALSVYIDPGTPEGTAFLQKLRDVRNGLYYEMGVIYPPVQVTSRAPMEAGSYRIWLNEVPVITGHVRVDALLVNASADHLRTLGIGAEDTKNPATGKPCAWIARAHREKAVRGGLQVWDTHEILIMHLVHFLKRHGRDMVGLQEAQWMLTSLKEFYPNLVEEVVPKMVSLQQLTEILQRLVEEGISIRDLKAILQSLSESAKTSQDSLTLTERVRASIKRKICYQLSEGRPTLYVYQLAPEIEEVFRNSIRQSSNGPYLTMDPDNVKMVTGAVEAIIGKLPMTAQDPVILADGEIRRFVKKLLDFQFPQVAVLSYDQLTSEISVQPLGFISWPVANSINEGQPGQLNPA